MALFATAYCVRCIKERYAPLIKLKHPLFIQVFKRILLEKPINVNLKTIPLNIKRTTPTKPLFGFLGHALLLVICMVLLYSCSGNTKPIAPVNNAITIDTHRAFEIAQKQLDRQRKKSERINRIPRTVTAGGELHWTNPKFDWTEGFFPGSLWYLYEESKDEKWKNSAEHLQSLFEDHKFFTTNHDLGFIFNTSYGNAYRITGNEAYKKVMVTAADSLITRFNSAVGCIKSWDVDKGWQAKRNWRFPVIIDNMMNLELLFKASEITGNPKYKNIAVTHANTTLTNHFRVNNSSYHVIDYDPESGKVRGKQTAQGFSDDSAWARGQAWGVYGYTVCYRYTKDNRYLAQAEKIAEFIFSNKSTPENGIPYWDYNAPNIPNEPVDASAAAITVSALIELDEYTKESYLPQINTVLKTLSSDTYLAGVGENHNFLLRHCVGSIPHGNEIDVPLNYADYYYLEALSRYKKRFENK